MQGGWEAITEFEKGERSLWRAGGAASATAIINGVGALISVTPKSPSLIVLSAFIVREREERREKRQELRGRREEGPWRVFFPRTKREKRMILPPPLGLKVSL